MPRSRLRRSLVLLPLSAALGPVRASLDEAPEPWATGVGRIVVPRAVGGAGDLLGRALAEYFGRARGQRFVVENHPEAAGANAVRKVAAAPPDGLTLLASDFASLLAAPVLQPRLEIDPVAGLEHIALVADVPLVIVARPGIVANTVAALLATAPGSPDLFCGTAGVGSNGHLVCERLIAAGAAQLVHVPFRGAAHVITALLGGQITHAVLTLASALPYLADRRMHALALTSLRRVDAAAATPTFEEFGMPDLTFTNWYGLSAPRDMPGSTVRSIRTAVEHWQTLESTRSMFASRAMQARPVSGARFSEFIEAERARWTPLLRDALASGRR